MLTVGQSASRRPEGASGSGKGVCGGVWLTFRKCEETGRTVLGEQYFRPPMHLSKPYWNGETLLLNLVSPTAGLLERDTLEADIQVREGAAAVVTTPAATRVFTMQGEAEAVVRQSLRVAEGGFLELFPEKLILQKGASLSQRTEISVAQGGICMFSESIAPGRTARGEVFEFSRFSQHLTIKVADELVLLERYRLEPGTPSVASWRAVFPNAYYGNFFLAGTELPEPKQLIEELHALQHAGAWVGASALRKHGVVVRVLAADAVALQRMNEQVRAALHGFIGRQVTSLRRV